MTRQRRLAAVHQELHAQARRRQLATLGQQPGGGDLACVIAAAHRMPAAKRDAFLVALAEFGRGGHGGPTNGAHRATA